MEQRAQIARALPLREGFDLLSAHPTPDGRLIIAAVNDPLGPQRFAPGGFAQLARVRQQSFVVALDLASGNVRFLEFDTVLRRVHVVGPDRVLCELGYPFSQSVTLWNPSTGKRVAEHLASTGDDNQVVVAVDPAGQRALIGRYYRKEYNDTDPYLGLTVVELHKGTEVGEELRDGADYRARRKDKKATGAKHRYGEYGPEIVDGAFVPEGVRVVLARRDRLAAEHNLWTPDLQRFLREEPAAPSPEPSARMRRTGARLGPGLATGRWAPENGSVRVTHHLRGRNAEIRAALSLVAGAEFWFESDADAASFALHALSELSPAPRYAHTVGDTTWRKVLARAERVTEPLARELIAQVAQRTHYESGFGAVLFRAGRKEATAWSSSVLVSGSAVAITEPLSVLDDPTAYIARLSARLGTRVFLRGSAGPRLAGLPFFDAETVPVASSVAARWRGVDVSGSIPALNWLVALPTVEGFGGGHAVVARLEAQLPEEVLAAKLPRFVEHAAALRALPDPREAYRARLADLPPGSVLHTLPGGLLLQTTPAPLHARAREGTAAFAPLRHAWQWLLGTPLYGVEGRTALWQCAETYRRWFYTPDESKAEADGWAAEQTAYWERMRAARQQPIHTQGDFDAEFGD